MSVRKIGFLIVFVVCLAAPARADGARQLSQLLTKGAELNEQVRDLNKQISALSEQVDALFKAYLPSTTGAYAKYEWDCHYGAGFIALNLKDKDTKQQVAWVHVMFYPKMSEAERGGFQKTCNGFPAKRFANRWVWVLVGRIELRVCATLDSFKSDKALDDLVKAFDLKGLKKL
ncbi:MAG: hypothetical protein GXP25_11500 [Planctomycetes bacterium]|nr:hypothetical protein [Planctomycetota bacterium]